MDPGSGECSFGPGINTRECDKGLTPGRSPLCGTPPMKRGYGNLRLIAVTNSGSPFFAAA